MAKKRMVTQQIIDSDAFLDMPLSSHALYFHLLVRADDEGFSNNYKKTVRMVRATEDDLKILIAKKFIIIFESGVLVIKHWLIHNTIRKNRITPTTHTKKKSHIRVKENGSYTLRDSHNIINGNQVADICQPDDCIGLGLDKIRLDKISIDKTSIEDSKESMSVKTDSEPVAKIDWNSILEYWNTNSMVKDIRTITDKRKTHITARIKQHGDDSIYEVIDNINNSKFLQGENNRSWMITFDWLVQSPNNFLKVLEGNYNDKDDVEESSDYNARLEKMQRAEVQMNGGNHES